MQSETIAKPKSHTLRQISIYVDNKVGRFNDIIKLFFRHDIHLIALCTLDTTDSGLVRTIVDQPHKAIEVLHANHLAFNVVEVLGIEIQNEQYIKQITGALMEAEINIHYLYPFLMRPNGNSGLVIGMEDSELAAQVLVRHQFKVLSENDIAR